jgi:hypothetical protein
MRIASSPIWRCWLIRFDVGVSQKPPDTVGEFAGRAKAEPIRENLLALWR